MVDAQDLKGAVAHLYHLRRAGIKLDLAPVIKGFSLLGDPQHAYDTLHVAGTNGKGTTCSLLEAFLTPVRRVGLFTSPHLVRFTERIRVQGAPIDDDLFMGLLSELREAVPSFSFFETATAMAFLAFKHMGVEAAVVETGLGGRLDSTSVVTPSVVVLTSIGADHALALTGSHERVLWEKCGVLRPGVPAVFPALSPALMNMATRIAAARGAKMVAEGSDFTWRSVGASFTYQSPAGRTVSLQSPFSMGVQNRSLALALTALELYLGALPEGKALQQALDSYSLPGRLQRSGRYILDGAHNPAAAKSLAAGLSGLAQEDSLLLLGLNADKDIEGVLAPLLKVFPRVATAPLDSERGLSPSALAKRVRELGGEIIRVLPELTLAALRDLPGDPVVVTGSFYLVGAVQKLLLSLEGDSLPLTDPAL